jgi:hypothetical protein
VEVVYSRGKGGQVTKNHISEVTAEMQNSPTAAYIRECTSFHERVMLAATWRCLKKSGVGMVKWEEVWDPPITLAYKDRVVLIKFFLASRCTDRISAR